MPARFDFQQFQAVTPLDGVNIWAYLLDRYADRITVKRRKPALENLEKIFNATFKLANAVGFRAMNLRDLCGETGLSMGGLYGYISSKDQLAEMIEDVVRHATLEVPKMYVNMDDPLDRLEALVRASIYVSEILQPWFYFVFMDSRVLQAEQRGTAKESEMYVQALFADVIATIPERPEAGPDLIAAHLMAMFQDWYVKRWKYRAADIDPDRFADSAVRMMRGYLSAGVRA
ncbi:TetR/AcrR family transcriptional regulator [Duganella sp. BuS-21]|uniref:TetR/AcrR family transcriptional regulator n=1 Tax=Duganella sp. BuS-21 TaxID=2943848 RepID=UPI0035A5E8AE